jgi:hypothetical protein
MYTTPYYIPYYLYMKINNTIVTKLESIIIIVTEHEILTTLKSFTFFFIYKESTYNKTNIKKYGLLFITN